MEALKRGGNQLSSHPPKSDPRTRMVSQTACFSSQAVRTLSWLNYLLPPIFSVALHLKRKLRSTLTNVCVIFKLKLLASPKSRTAQSVHTCIHAACANYPSSGNIQMSFWQKQEDAIPNPPLNSIVINCFAPQLLPTIETKPPNV